MFHPHSPQAALEFPQPPSRKDTKSDPAATLAWLKENIATIYMIGRETSLSQHKPPVLAQSAYLRLYTTTHNYVEITRFPRKKEPDDPEPLDGESLYRCLEQIIRSHCSEIKDRLFAPDNSTGANGEASYAMIQEYLVQWKMLTQHLAALVARVMRHLERHWIKRELDEKRKAIYAIEDLHTVIWKKTVLHVGGESTTVAASTARAELKHAVGMLLQEQSEDGVETDRKDLAERFLESLRTMDVDLEASI